MMRIKPWLPTALAFVAASVASAKHLTLPRWRSALMILWLRFIMLNLGVLLAASGSALAEYPPKILTSLRTDHEPVYLASAGDYVYFTDYERCYKLDFQLDTRATFASQLCYPSGLAADLEYIYVSQGPTFENCQPDRLYQFTVDGIVTRHWCNYVQDGCWASRMVVDGDGNLYVTHNEIIRKYNQVGQLLATWQDPINGHRGGFTGITAGPDGYIYASNLDTNVIKKLDTSLTTSVDLVPNGEGESGVSWPMGISADPDGNLYVVDLTEKRIKKFNTSGQFLMSWTNDDLTGSITTDYNGYVYVATKNGIVKYDNKPGPPPTEPPPPHPSSIFLHVGKVTGQRLGCESLPDEPGEIVTLADADANGRPYYVYLLGSPDTRTGVDAGLTGMQMGIKYEKTTDHPRDITVSGWITCSVLNFPQDDWPASGSGNTITWTPNPSTCQQKEMVLAGYMYISVYGPTVMSVIRYPANDLAKTADCDGAEQVVGDSQLGWVSFGRGARFGDTNGCNPLYENCAAVVPVQRTTWGQIKVKYGN